MRIGIDEAGRGCWAGPLVAAAVALPTPLDGLMDSKALTPKKGGALAALIQSQAMVGVGVVQAEVIDQRGLTWATTQAMRQALAQIMDSNVSSSLSEIIIDGNFNYLPEQPRVQTVIKADALVAEVSAASIIAKMTRDQIMTIAANEFPEYGFEKHVGYGTMLHKNMLTQFGPCKLHRLSYKPVKAAMELL